MISRILHALLLHRTIQFLPINANSSKYDKQKVIIGNRIRLGFSFCHTFLLLMAIGISSSLVIKTDRRLDNSHKKTIGSM